MLLLTLTVGCSPETPHSFATTGHGSGGGDDTGSPSIGVDAFAYDALTDVVPYDSATTVLATNADQASLDVIDMNTGSMVSRVELGGTPMRVKWDGDSGKAYVVHGTHEAGEESANECTKGCTNRLDVVDVAGGTYESLTLEVDGTAYSASDVTLGSTPGRVFLLADGDMWWSQESVLDVDTGTGEIAVWPLQEEFEVNAIPLHYDGTSIYAEQWRFAFDAEGGRLAEVNNYAPDDYDDWNGAGVHSTLAPDGEGILFPWEYDSDAGGKTVAELDPVEDTVLHTYVLNEGVGYGADDMAYSADGTRVVTIGLDYDSIRLQVFDRFTAGELLDVDMGPEDGTISYDETILVLTHNDAVAWVYLSDSNWNDGTGLFQAWALPDR